MNYKDNYSRDGVKKRDHGYSLTEFNAIKKKSNESMSGFIKIFNKLYNSVGTGSPKKLRNWSNFDIFGYI